MSTDGNNSKIGNKCVSLESRHIEISKMKTRVICEIHWYREKPTVYKICVTYLSVGYTHDVPNENNSHIVHVGLHLIPFAK